MSRFQKTYRFIIIIDQLVDELDGEELIGLRRGLEEHEPSKEREFSHSLETLLDERSEERQMRQK